MFGRRSNQIRISLHSQPRYIYALIDPRDDTVRYVGVTKDVYFRLHRHMKSAGNLRCQFSVMIGALVWDTLFMIIGVLLLYRSAGEQFIASINFLTTTTTGYILPVQPHG